MILKLCNGYKLFSIKYHSVSSSTILLQRTSYSKLGKDLRNHRKSIPERLIHILMKHSFNEKV